MCDAAEPSRLGSHNDAMTDREAAWDAVHEALPAGWTVGPPTFDPGVPGWSVTARTVAYSRLKPPQTVTGTGVDETPPCATWTTVSAACRSRTAHGWPSASDGSGWPTSRCRGMVARDDRARADRGRARGRRPAVPLIAGQGVPRPGIASPGPERGRASLALADHSARTAAEFFNVGHDQ